MLSQGDSFPPFQGYHIQKIGSKYDQVWQPFLKKISLLQKDGKTVDDERSLANVSEFKKKVWWKFKWVGETGEEVILAMEKLEQWLEILLGDAIKYLEIYWFDMYLWCSFNLNFSKFLDIFVYKKNFDGTSIESP